MIKQLINAYKFLKQARSFIPEAQTDDFWAPENAKAYGTFMASESGQKLKHRINNIIYFSAIRATMPREITDKDIESGDYKRGVARGMQLFCAELDKHLTVATPHSGKLDTPASSPLDLVDVALQE